VSKGGEGRRNRLGEKIQHEGGEGDKGVGGKKEEWHHGNCGRVGREEEWQDQVHRNVVSHDPVVRKRCEKKETNDKTARKRSGGGTNIQKNQENTTRNCAAGWDDQGMNGRKEKDEDIRGQIETIIQLGEDEKDERKKS